jgi:hypothetical protein
VDGAGQCVGGDTFDYALDEDAPQVSITDAAGHDVAAALLATLLVGSLRNGRRRGLDLGEQTRNANDALAAHSSVGQFVTGQLMRIDLDTATAKIVNAGHPFPLRLRDGRVEEIELDIDFRLASVLTGRSGCRSSLMPEGGPMSSRRPSYAICPGDRIEVEAVQPDGGRALVVGKLDKVPEAAGGRCGSSSATHRSALPSR